MLSCVSTADKQQVFHEVFRVLKPGGKFYFTTWDKTDRVEIFKTIYNENVVPFFAGEDTARFFVPFSLYDHQQLKLYFTTVGFQHPTLEAVTLQGVSESAHHLVQGFFVTHAVGQEVADRDPAAFQAIAQNLEQAIIKKFNDKPVVCALTSHFGWATKP